MASSSVSSRRSIVSTEPDAAIVVAAIAEQLGEDMDKHLFGRRARAFLKLKLCRLEEVYGRKITRAALRLRHREDRANYRAELKRQKQDAC
jgi:hypothetical protein